MIIKLLKDSFGVLLIVILVAGGIFIFSQSLKNDSGLNKTAISVRSVNTIGELICAEYYGEVVESLKSIKKENSQLKYTIIYTTARNLVLEKYASLPSSIKENKKQKEVARWFKDTQEAIYDKQGFLLLKKISDQNNIKDFVIFELMQNDWSEFKSTYTRKFNKLLKTETGKEEVVYIGRGWVKAGFDLSELDSAQIEMGTDTIVINNLNPVILDADINPWFVPNEVKGFEIIRLEKDRLVELSEISMVKHRCKEKLIQQAMEHNILLNAIEYGQESLGGLYTLLSPIEDIEEKVVIINPSPLFVTQTNILSDFAVSANDYEILISQLPLADSIKHKDKDYYYRIIQDINLACLGNPHNDEKWVLKKDSLLKEFK